MLGRRGGFLRFIGIRCKKVGKYELFESIYEFIYKVDEFLNLN